MAGRLVDIAGREGFEVVDAGEEAKGKKPAVERAALAALAAAATGSLRDGLSLFDQAAARSGGGVKAEDVSALLGAPDRTALVALLGAVLASDRIGVFKGCAELEAAGAEPRATLHDLTALVRGAVRLAADPAALPPTGLSEEGAERVREFARLTPYATLLRLLSLLSESDGTLRRSDVPALAFEVLLLKVAELPRLVPIEEILAGRIPASSGPGATSSDTAAGGGGFSLKGDMAAERNAGGSRASSFPAAQPHSPSKKTTDVAGAPPLHVSDAPASGSGSHYPSKKTTDAASAPPKHEAHRGHGSRSEAEDPSSSDVPRFVGLTPLEIVPDAVPTPDPAGAFRAAVEKKHSQLGAVLEDASVRLEGKDVLISLDPPSIVTEKRLAEPAMAKVLEEAAIAVLGKGAKVTVEGVAPPAGDLTAAAAVADPKALEREHLRMKVATDERVKRMMDLFGGEIADVKRDGGPDRAKGR